jgi:hypothetical protein
MTQIEFTDFALRELLIRFPLFYEHYIYETQEVVKIDCPSKRSLLTLRISTNENELTVGFSAGDSQFGWHIHMDILGAQIPEDKVELAKELIQSIISDKETIIYSSQLGYFISECNNIEEYKQERSGTSVKTLTWAKRRKA